MVTLFGSLFLFFSFSNDPTIWLERAKTLLPWAFLLGLFMSFTILSIKAIMRPSFTSISWQGKGLSFGVPIACLGLLATFLPLETYQKEIAITSYILFFLWIDAMLLDLWLVQRRFSFEGAASMLSSRLKSAVRSRNLHSIIAAFESISLLCEEVFARPNTRETVAGTKLFLSSVELVLTHIPQVSLPADEKETETLLDTYFVFQAVVAKKVEALMLATKEAPSDQKWELIIKILSKVTSLFLSIHESFSIPFLSLTEDLAVFLQKNGSSKELEVYAGCVEAIKSIIEYATAKRRDVRVYVGPIVAKLEGLMKERFRRDRTINPAYLMQPFAEVASFLAHPSFTELAGREELIADLKRILSQFAVLETISERMSGHIGSTDTSSTYHQDIPYMKQDKE